MASKRSSSDSKGAGTDRQSSWRPRGECDNMVADRDAQVLEIIDVSGSTPFARPLLGELVSARPKRSHSRAVLLALAAATLACNDPHFLTPAPTLRGITIPLPPPSFADAMLVTIDVEGGIP